MLKWVNGSLPNFREKRSRNEGQSSGTSSAITSSSALENSMEVLTLAETLKDSLDKENRFFFAIFVTNRF